MTSYLITFKNSLYTWTINNISLYLSEMLRFLWIIKFEDQRRKKGDQIIYMYTRRHTKEIIFSVGDVFVPLCVTSILPRLESDYRLGTLVTVTNTSNHLYNFFSSFKLVFHPYLPKMLKVEVWFSRTIKDYTTKNKLI